MDGCPWQKKREKDNNAQRARKKTSYSFSAASSTPGAGPTSFLGMAIST